MTNFREIVTSEAERYQKIYYQVLEDEERDYDMYYWKNWNRFPEVLCPEYKVWYWRSIGHWWFKARYNLWWSTPVQAIVQGKNGVKVKKPTQWNPNGWHYENKGFWNWFGKRFHWLEEYLRQWIGWLQHQTIEWETCIECGFHYDFLEISSDWFRGTGGGSRFTGDYTQHWFEGMWTCPRCLKQWEYEDSD